MRSKLRRLCSAVMAIAITCSIATAPAQASKAPQFSDVDGHWGEEAIVRWADYGVIEGSNGQFNPDAPITRAEMAAAIARLLGLTETAENTFADVEEGAWYAQAILQCAAAGIIQGSNGMANPNGTLTRQEAAVMLGRALGIQPDEGDVTFLDGEQVAGWAAGYVSAMSDRGVLNGVGGNQFAPLEDINRASVVTVLNNAIAAYANEPGATVQANGGLTLVAADDVTVTGTAADILVAQGAAEGEITVQADTTGTVSVNAAGATVVLAAGADVNSVDVAEDAAGARVVVEEDASVGAVSAAAPESEIQVSGTAEAVEAAATAGNAVITVSDGAAVGSITTAAAGTAITVSGTVENVTVAGTAGSTTVTANRGAAITSVDNSAEDVTISGSGTVERVTTSGNDTTINTDGTELTVAEGVTGVTENNKDVAAGETVTTDRPTSGGGSSSGGGSHSHSYTDGVCSCGAYDPAWAQVDSAEDWATAVAAGQNIVVTAAVTAATQQNVPGAITVNGRNLTITSENKAENAADAAGILVTGAAAIKNLTVSGPNSTTTAWDEGEYGIKVYNAENVTLQDVTVTGANAGIQVNSSAVTLAGTVTVSGNEWGGIEVCKSSNEGLTAGTLNINGAAVVCTDTAVPAIWIDGTTEADGVVNGADGMTQIAAGDQIYYYTAGTAITLARDVTISGTATVEDLTVNEGVTLTVSEGSTLTVNGTLTNNGTITGGGTVAASGYARQNGNWVKLFSAGLGTEESPYEIADAQQLGYVGDLSGTETVPVYVQLNADIDLSTTNSLYGAYQLNNAVFDGNGHRIYSASVKRIYGVFAYTLGKTEIKDLTYDLSNLDSYAYSGDCVSLIYSAKGGNYVEGTADSLVLNDVTVTGSGSCTGNCGAFIANEFMPKGSTITFTGCTYDAEIVGTGYNACFIGWQYPATPSIDYQQVSVGPSITFDSCSVTGELVATQAAVFVANGSNAGVRDYVFSDNTISGTVRGTEVAKYFTAVSFSGHTAWEAAAQSGCTTTSDRNVYVGATDSALAISVSDDKSISVTASDNSNVTDYKVEIGIYTNLYKDNEKNGTWLFFAVAEVAAEEIGDISIYAYDFIDAGYDGLGEITEDAYGNSVAELNGTTYYVVKDYIDDVGNQGYVGTQDAPGTKAAQIIRVTAYEGDTMYSSASAH